MSESTLWCDTVEESDYDAAHNYLCLLLDPHWAKEAVRLLQHAEIGQHRVNDILRATHRDPLPNTDPGLQWTAIGVRNNKKLSPILVVSFGFGADIADGYHRVSYIYHATLDGPFQYIPMKMAHLPEVGFKR